MPDKIVSLWKVLGEVSETVFLDPPNTQYDKASKNLPASQPQARCRGGLKVTGH